MTDTQIVELYLQRCENAIAQTAQLYGAYCRTIAMNILHNEQDCEEVVNDSYLSAWNSIPPQNPQNFSSFIGRIVRNTALDRYRKATSQKRGGEAGQGGKGAELLLSELEACIPCANTVEAQADANELSAAIDSFVGELREEEMAFFVLRYWHGSSVAQIAERMKVSQSKVKTALFRTRAKLKTYLESRGIMT